MLPRHRRGDSRLIEWTGERCVPWAPETQVIYEHFHRYLWASSLPASSDWATSVGGTNLSLTSSNADRGVQATVSCTGACEIGAYTITTIGNQAPFTDSSSLAHLNYATSKTLSVPYTTEQLNRIGAALQSGTKVSVSVAGAIVDAGGNIEKRSAAKRLLLKH